MLAFKVFCLSFSCVGFLHQCYASHPEQTQWLYGKQSVMSGLSDPEGLLVFKFSVFSKLSRFTELTLNKLGV